jgi:CheY-like chemotaxis protein
VRVKHRILLVDDEQRVLDGYRRTLRKGFDLSTACSGRDGLALINIDTPFSVVVSDFQMPEMNGVQFLTEVAARSPDTARIMLTGQADLNATIASINESKVFRFLTKPCPPDMLATALNDGIAQFRLVRAERELLEDTLQRTVAVLIEVLGLVDPDAHHASARLRDRVRALCDRLQLDDIWQFELASMLSQLGTIALPPEAVARFRTGQSLSPADQMLLDGHPQSAYNLLVKIPRLEPVARMVLAQERPPMSRPLRPEEPDADDLVAVGAHLLNVATEFDRLRGRMTAVDAIQVLRSEGGPPFRQALIDALETDTTGIAALVAKRVGVDDLEAGYILNEDVVTHRGLLLLSKGQQLTGAHLERIRAFSESTGVPEPIEVLVEEEGVFETQAGAAR